ncbi:MAG TPA: hypothetical protein VL306_02965 [Methylomirabilota bacterium]|nr:hypothetical protein [Methylomirabilota bacterium]
MKISESINRGFNLLAVSIVSLSGFAFAAEIFLENDMPDKLDDALLLLLGIVAIWWYLRKNNKFTLSITPVVFVWLSLAIKIMAVIIEHADKEAVGDDFGALTLFILSGILVTYQYYKSKKLTEQSI